MKKPIVIMVIMSFGILSIFIPIANSSLYNEEIVDQSQIDIGTGCVMWNHFVSQFFKPTKTPLTKVALFLRRDGNPISDMVVSIREPVFQKTSRLEEYDMVIIAPSEFSDAIQPLINHKDSVGIKTYLKIIEDIYLEYSGRDEAEKIKYFIKDAIESFGIDYVLLIGNKEKLPVRYVTIHFSAEKHKEFNEFFTENLRLTNNEALDFISDLYYADIYDEKMEFCSWDTNNNSLFAEANETLFFDDVDLYPDISIGRLLCGTSSDVNNIVNKIIQYEEKTYGESWFNNLILVGGDSHTQIFGELFVTIVAGKGRIAWEGEYMCEQVAKIFHTFNAKKCYGSAFFGIRANRLSTENINNAINEGAGFLLIGLHGNVDRVATHPPFTSSKLLPSPDGYWIDDIDMLSNRDKLPVAVIPSCYCGDFDSVNSPFAWEFVNHQDGGSIASYALTTSGNIWPSTLATESLSGHTAMSVFQSYSDGIENAGDIWIECISRYLNDDEAITLGTMNSTSSFIKTSGVPVWMNNVALQEWILLGDPSLKIGGYS